MRLLFLIHSDEPGGAETAFLQLVTGLARRGHAVTVGIAGDGWLRARLDEAGVDVAPLSFRGPGDVSLLWSIVRLIRATRPDVIQCFMSRMNLYGSLAGALSGVPVVAGVRGPEGGHGSATGPSDRVHGRWGWLPEWLVGRFATRIVTVSRDLEQRLAARAPAGKLATIPNGVDLARFGSIRPEDGCEVREQFGIPRSAFLVGSVGRLDPIKRFEDLIEAVAQSQDGRDALYALIVGDGAERGRLEDLAAARGIRDRVVFAGMREDVPRLLAAMDLFVLPSASEGQPNAVLEAMAAGRPVVATDVGGVRELVVPGETGLLVPCGEPAALAEAIRFYRQDASRARRAGEAGGRRAASQFALESMVARYEAIYEENSHPEYRAKPDRVYHRPPSICLVAPSLTSVGGQSVQAAALMRGLEAAGVRVRHVATDPPLPPGLQRVGRVRGLRTLVRLACFARAVRRAAAGTELVHVFTASYASFLLAMLPSLWARRRCGRPLVLHYHSGEAAAHLHRHRRLAIPLLRQADRIVVPSGYLAEAFAAHGLAATVIPNVVDGEQFARGSSAWPRGERPASSVDPPGIRLLCTRNLEPLYDIATVLEAFARVQEEMPGAMLTLAGAGSEEERLRRLAEALDLQRVRFIGAIPHEAMPAVYREADIWVNASRIDTMPVSLLEAFAAGLPVVSTDAGGIPWLVRDGVTGLLVPQGDPEALATAILRVARDPALAADLSCAGRAEVEGYAWNRVRDAWLELYRAAMSRCRVPGAECPAQLGYRRAFPSSGPGTRRPAPGTGHGGEAAP
jgi:glycosyltransferase involved in cell wall biosynthesis